MSQQPDRRLGDRLPLRFPRLVRFCFRRVLRLPVESRVRRRVLELIVRRMIDQVNGRDLDGLVALAVEPDVTLRAVGFGVGTPELLRGHDGIRAFFAEWELAMGWPRYEIEQVVDMGDRVLIKAPFVSRGQRSGVETINLRGAALALFSERGLVAEMQFHWVWETAAAAAGLPEAGDR